MHNNVDVQLGWRVVANLLHHCGSQLVFFFLLSSLVLSLPSSLIDRMLQRDPKRRASLEEIEGHPWLQGVDPSPATKFTTPLVSHKNLSDEEHNSIIQRMVLGDIADREAIVE